MHFHEKEYAAALEAILFMAQEPLTPEKLAELIEVAPADIADLLEMLQKRYEDKSSGLGLMKLENGYQLATKGELAPYIQALYKQPHQALSGAALEVLSIVAYRQPVTRGEIELIRGVQSDGALRTLLEKNLVREAGRRESPGRPFLYETTTDFLRYFRLHSLAELPELE